MKTLKKRAEWSVKIPGPGKRSKRGTAKAAVKTAIAVTSICVAYFGVIAVLMSPAFDVVPPA